MSLSHNCGSTRRQLPPTPSCQCATLLSYKPRPQPVFRPEAPKESLKEMFDDIFRIGTAYLIRSGEWIPPAEMAYFECLNELDVPECISPPQLDQDRPFGPFVEPQDGHKKVEASHPQTTLDSAVKSDATQQPEKLQTEEPASPETQNIERDHDIKLASQPNVEQGVVPLIVESVFTTVLEEPNPIVHCITEDELGTMGWKDLFKLARARGVGHGPMMKSRQEFVKKIVEKFGVEIPIYENDKLPKEFPSKHSSCRWVCHHQGRYRRQRPVFQRY
ncbi:hypothetical protein Agabi119p4_2088 [Agaricus bisporus var. burnettii]|uniref:Uncharacterized protein n=1 Tax=Agaricus bisporus var. burnettii TaxID=192524 RepID=A0A8H7F8J4_AGABI|nr:hypothetical protein Agabi119p4_2088 [Agaricus bisporus var. burnettii]